MLRGLPWSRSALVVALLALGGCAAGGGASAGRMSAPPPDHAQMVVTANPWATSAGIEMLRRGGSAVDAAVAAQAVLGLVEPQASGMLGGSLILLWQPGDTAVTSIDGMPSAPAASTRAVMQTRQGQLLDPREVAFSPRAVGVPGTLPALWAAHKRAGKLTWASLFEPAVHLAEAGIPMPRQLASLLAEPGMVSALGDVAAPYLGADGLPLAEGARFFNRPAETVLRRIAALGPDGLYAEGRLSAIMAALHREPHPSLITATELTDARPRIGTALCKPYAGETLCTAPPPSMGGMVMLQTLLTVPPGDPADAWFMHRFLEASRLAEADRRRYLADPDFVPVPVEGLLDHDYLAGRAALITPGQTIERPRPGELADEAKASDPGAPQAGTSQVVVADHAGMVVSMTSTVNLHFGARRAALGMVLNNALINFAPPPPTTFTGQEDHYANEMAPGKRPLTPAAPVIVLDDAGRPVLAGGGAGGPAIPDTVALAVMDILANHRGLPETLAAGHAHAADPDHIVLEEGTKATALRAPLEAAGHRVEVEPVSTGNAFIQRTAHGWVGAADPRRDGTASGLP